jgi:carbamoyl-phosphate synthase small subunit
MTAIRTQVSPEASTTRTGLLVLSDGTTFSGRPVGAPAEVTTGELVFNTALSGYQEVLSDPSYAGQIIAFTYPQIGNYGVTVADNEAQTVACRGIIVRDLTRRASNWRASSSLEEYLVEHAIAGLSGVDTRRLTRHIRAVGAITCAFGTAEEAVLLAAARSEPGTLGVDLVQEVTTPAPYVVGGGPYDVVVYDFGVKATMIAQLSRFARVLVVPARTPPEEVLRRRPSGVLLSNGPGDPAALPDLVATVRSLVGSVPLFGICLGHQLLGTALGGSTYKLEFGHHGANHPVQRLSSGAVEITAENHGYAVREGSIPDAAVTHRNLNDGVIEGLAAVGERAFSVQYHPEAGPGPHDARYLFAEFQQLMERTNR